MLLLWNVRDWATGKEIQMHRQVFGVVALLAAAQSPVLAQEAAALPAAVEIPAAPAAPVMRQIVLPPNSEVVITPNDTLTTKGKQLKERLQVPSLDSV